MPQEAGCRGLDHSAQVATGQPLLYSRSSSSVVSKTGRVADDTVAGESGVAVSGQGPPEAAKGSSAAHGELVPVQMLIQYAYCRRLGYLRYAHGESVDNEYIVDGRFKHRNVDRPAGGAKVARDADGEDGGGGHGGKPGDPIRAHAMTLSDDRLGMVAKTDLVEFRGKCATPVEYKRGTVPDTPEMTYLDHRVHVCALGLLLRANGYECSGGVVYYIGSKRRIDVPLNAELEAETLRLLDDLRRDAASDTMPPPLVDSPKCPGCSMVGICLPDETNLLGGGEPDRVTPDQVRRMYPIRSDAVALYVQEQGARIGKSGDCLVVRRKDSDPQTYKLIDVSEVVVYGNVQVTTQAIREMCARSIPLCYLSYGGWYAGMVTGASHKNVHLRIAQHKKYADPGGSMAIAREIVYGKIRNCATLLRRNGPKEREDVEAAVASLEGLAERARREAGYEELLGLEGLAARTYFGQFRSMIKADGAEFDFEGRNRRPPRDMVNAILSFLYSLLVRDASVAVGAVGFDPHLGYLHRPKYGKPALALDMIEEFRPIVADSTCIRAINNGEVGAGDTVRSGLGVNLTASGRRAVIEAYSRRMDSQVTHPLLGYPASYKRVLVTQARLLARHLLGEIPSYPAFRTR